MLGFGLAPPEIFVPYSASRAGVHIIQTASFSEGDDAQNFGRLTRLKTFVIAFVPPKVMEPGFIDFQSRSGPSVVRAL